MRLYLDTSVYNRPFDDQTQARIWIETLALALILQWVEEGSIELVASAVVSYENSRNPFATRRVWVEQCLELARHQQQIDDVITARARALEASGFSALDALHLAAAEAADCDYFSTCDDRIIRRYQGELTALDPLTFVRRLSGGEA